MVDLSPYKISGSPAKMTADNFKRFFQAVSSGFSTLDTIVQEWIQSGSGIAFTPSVNVSEGGRCTATVWNSNLSGIKTELDELVKSNGYYSSASSELKSKITAIGGLAGKSANDEISQTQWNTLIDNLQAVLSACETYFSQQRDIAVEARTYWHFGDAMPIKLAASAS